MFPIRGVVSVVVRVEVFQQYDTRCILVAKQCNCIVSLLLKVSETYDVAEGLDGIKYSVGSTITLYQSMLT